MKHKIFEVNVFNNLDRESIFVQIRSDLHVSESSDIHHSISQSHPTTIVQANHHPSNLISNNSHQLQQQQQIQMSNPGPIMDNIVNQRYMNQQRSRQQNHTIYNTSNGNNIEQKAAVPVSTKIETSHSPEIKEMTDIIINYPGFVLIAPCQSLPIPVILNNKSDWIAFATIYVLQDSNDIICLANQFQINQQNIEIMRSLESGNIVIVMKNQLQNNNLLYQWGMPQYLCNSLRNNGWEDISLWHSITETDLIEMGFQRGHRRKFFQKVSELLQTKTKNNNHFEIKHIFSAWNLPLYLSRSMIENGWIDPTDWTQITDQHLNKMGFKDGHIIKFVKEIQNNKHLISFQQMQNNKQEMKEFEIESAEMEMEMEMKEFSAQKINKMNKKKPMFIIDPKTITHEQFWYQLQEKKMNYSYYLEMKDSESNQWSSREEISDRKHNNICELDMNTTYFIRIKAENKRNGCIIYSSIVQIKTKDEQWKNMHLPKIPDFKYAVSSNNKQITVEFDRKALSKIKQTQFDERYSLDIGLSKDVNNLESVVSWKNVATLRKDKLVYKYSVNDQKDADWVHVGISGRNDLGQRYNQCTRTRQFPFNQVVKRINTTIHGNNLQFDETMTVATKIDQDYRYSTFAFGQPITNEMCNRYDMYVKVNKLRADCFIGFAPSLDSVINWNQPLGCGGNKHSSVGVSANKLSSNSSSSLSSQPQPQYQIQQTQHQFDQTEKKWDDGSIFVLSFDFLNDDCNIYLNENSNPLNGLDQNRLLKSIKLNQLKSVVPSFSLNSQGDSIQVVKWRLY